MIEFGLMCLEQACLYTPLLLGAFIIFSCMKVPNISIETSVVTGAVCAGYVLTTTQGTDPMIGLIAACCAGLFGGALIGLITSLLVVYGRLPNLLASILTMGIGYGFNLLLLGGSYVSLNPSNNPLTQLPFSVHPELGVLILLACVLVGLIALFMRTQLGLSFAVFGNNPHFFAHYGINASWVLGAGLVLGNALAGIAGYLIAQTSGFVDIHAGNGLSLFCITALILGRAVCGTIAKRSVLIPIVGLAVYAVLQQSLVRCGLNTQYFTIVQALIVIVVVLVYYQRRSAKELMGDHLGV